MGSLDFTGVFVTRRPKKTSLAISTDEIITTDEFSESDSRSTTETPVSVSGSEICASSTSTCDLRLSAEDASEEENGKSKRPKRKKKDRKAEENPAIDAVRYKTKMCKNWQLSEKCPYGPRCLFAHGSKEMRSYTVNHAAVSAAATSGSPERQFYALGHFPSFMPVPYKEDEQAALEPVAALQQPVAAHTHSPYTPAVASYSAAPPSYTDNYPTDYAAGAYSAPYPASYQAAPMQPVYSQPAAPAAPYTHSPYAPCYAMYPTAYQQCDYHGQYY